jgi:hypothetical protein
MGREDERDDEPDADEAGTGEVGRFSGLEAGRGVYVWILNTSDALRL